MHLHNNLENQLNDHDAETGFAVKTKINNFINKKKADTIEVHVYNMTARQYQSVQLRKGASTRAGP